jgi:hypothetical protein
MPSLSSDFRWCGLHLTGSKRLVMMELLISKISRTQSRFFVGT